MRHGDLCAALRAFLLLAELTPEERERFQTVLAVLEGVAFEHEKEMVRDWLAGPPMPQRFGRLPLITEGPHCENAI